MPYAKRNNEVNKEGVKKSTYGYTVYIETTVHGITKVRAIKKFKEKAAADNFFNNEIAKNML